MARKKERYSTCITNKTKLNETKPNEVIWSDIFVTLNKYEQKKHTKFINLLKSQIIFLYFSEALSMCQNLWM